MDYRDVSVKSKLIISLFQIVKFLLLISLFQKLGNLKKSYLFVDQMTKSYPASHKITSRIFARHYEVTDVTIIANVIFCRHSF